MDIKYLSRKFIISMLLGVISIVMLMNGSINESDFGIVIMATVISYIVGRTFDKKFSTGKFTYPIFKDRVISLFSREFVISLLAVIIMSYLCYIGKIGSGLWFQVVSSVGGIYNIFNVVEKVGS